MKKLFKILAVIAVLAVASFYSISKNTALASPLSPCPGDRGDCTQSSGDYGEVIVHNAKS